MLNKEIKLKTFSTILIASMIIVISLFGSQWQVGQAETVPTVPTIPFVYSITPDTICVGSSDTVVSVSGGNFIDTTYTKIKWLDANYIYSYITPDFVSSDGIKLDFTVEAAKLSQVWIASFWIVNHPEINEDEIIGPFYIDIIGCEFIYLPLIMK